ncbi:MAG: TolC family protein [Verrucomicrobiae bacterium]|nr:TolC family protein [Verrucomicrobiae bacterium]
MTSKSQNRKRSLRWLGGLIGILAVSLLLAGCTGIQTKGERAARADLETVNRVYQPNAVERNLPALANDSTLGDYLRFAMLNQPSVEAAYFDWAASVERITVERSLPDPRLSFESDIADIVMTVMPGLMQEFPGPGKLKAAADVATAESRTKYFLFETSVLQTAFSLKRAYYQLWFLDENVRINRQTLALLAELEETARAQNAAGKVTLQDVYRAQIEQDQLTTEIENLEDSRRPLVAQLKGALGLTRDQADPPQPKQFESTPLDLNGDALLDTAFARNPRLKTMEADVRMAEAAIALARKSKVPDFSLGLMADAKASPTMFRPLAGMTLPIWRDKIAAQVAQAQANKRAAEARLSSEQIMVTVDFAMKSYDYREITRNLVLLQEKLIPKAKQSLEIARAGYLSGQIDFFNLLDAERTLLNFQLQEVEARTRREIVLADLSLTIAGIAPQGAPILPQTNSNPSTTN